MGNNKGEKSALPTDLTEKELASLTAAKTQDEFQDFVDSYQTSHPSISANQIIALALINIINQKSLSITQKNDRCETILDFVFRHNNIDATVFTVPDSQNTNVILTMLQQEGVCSHSLSAAIYFYQKNNKIEKIHMSENMVQEFAMAIKSNIAMIYLHPRTVIDDFIRPIYDDASVESVVTKIDELTGITHWVDNYYMG